MKKTPDYISQETADHMEFCWHGMIKTKDLTDLLSSIDADYQASHATATEEQREAAIRENLQIVGYSPIDAKGAARTYFHKPIWG